MIQWLHSKDCTEEVSYENPESYLGDKKGEEGHKDQRYVLLQELRKEQELTPKLKTNIISCNSISTYIRCG